MLPMCTLRTCHECGARVPVEGECPVCYEARMASREIRNIERRDVKKTQAVAERMERIIELGRHADSKTAPSIAEILTLTIDKLGGVEGVANMWSRKIDAAMNADHIKIGLDAMGELAKLMVAVAPRVETVMNYREMSDDELERIQKIETTRLVVLDMVEKHPEIAPVLEQYLYDNDSAISTDATEPGADGKAEQAAAASA